MGACFPKFCHCLECGYVMLFLFPFFFEKGFDSFLSGWRFVDRYTCMEIPEEFKKVRMTLETPICFCLPDERDEGFLPLFSFFPFFYSPLFSLSGICPLSFIQNLIATQNQFLDRLYRIIFLPKEEQELEKPLSTHFKLHVSSRLRRRHTLEKGVTSPPFSSSSSPPPPPPPSDSAPFPSVPSPFTPMSPVEEENLFTRLFGRMSKSKIQKAEMEERERREEKEQREREEQERKSQKVEKEKGKEKEKRRHRKEKRKGKKKKDYLDFVDESFYENVESISAQNAKYFEMENYVDMRVPTHLLTSEHLISFDPESQLPILLQIYTEFTLAYGLGEEVCFVFCFFNSFLFSSVLVLVFLLLDCLINHFCFLLVFPSFRTILVQLSNI